MIVNDNVRSQLLGMRDSHTSSMTPHSTNSNDSQPMEDIEQRMQNDEPLAHFDPPQEYHPPPPPLQVDPSVPQPTPIPLPDLLPLHHPPLPSPHRRFHAKIQEINIS